MSGIGRAAPLLRVVRPGGPEDDEDAAVAQFLAAAEPESTLRVYATAFAEFEDWCAAKEHVALPATPQTVLRFLAALAQRTREPMSAATIAVYRAGIGYAHTRAELADPTRDPRVTRLLKGIKATRAAAGRLPDKAPAASLDDLRAAVTVAHETAHGWRAQIAARRDIAILLLGWASANRRSELAALRKSDLSLVAHPDGGHRLRIVLRGRKAHRDAITEQFITRGATDPLFCPWCAVLRWLAVIEAADTAAAAERRRQHANGQNRPDQVADRVSIAVQRLLRRDATTDPHMHRCDGPWPTSRHPGPLLRSLSRNIGGLPHSHKPITGQSIARIIDARSRAAGGPALRGHSLRAGLATHLFDTGASVEEVMAVTGHRRPETALSYDRRRQQRSGDVDRGL